ncbi:expressed unknown protein [Seminavis robusta]|uniref:Uncharacterized protein n=1 Tax=Seminavis robusta TaxID=568900 RepID=A0A9N8HF63_9STRA|nr:expressed unknown protein [Seminavis robusta]|eukprot:Sro334_g119880.1 n/a (141) ;mRNA; f:57131-57553
MTSVVSQRVLACAMLLCLHAALPAHAFLDTVRAEPSRKGSSSQLSMAWTLPTSMKPSFQPTWYQDCGNPTVRQVVYEDDYLFGDEDSYEFAFRNYGSDWSSDLEGPGADTELQPDHLPRGARISRAARRALSGIRNTLRP